MRFVLRVVLANIQFRTQTQIKIAPVLDVDLLVVREQEKQLLVQDPTIVYVHKIRAPVQTVLLLQEYRVPHMVKTFAMFATVDIILVVQRVLHMVDRVVMVH